MGNGILVIAQCGGRPWCLGAKRGARTLGGQAVGNPHALGGQSVDNPHSLGGQSIGNPDGDYNTEVCPPLYNSAQEALQTGMLECKVGHCIQRYEGPFSGKLGAMRSWMCRNRSIRRESVERTWKVDSWGQPHLMNEIKSLVFWYWVSWISEYWDTNELVSWYRHVYWDRFLMNWYLGIVVFVMYRFSNRIASSTIRPNCCWNTKTQKHQKWCGDCSHMKKPKKSNIEKNDKKIKYWKKRQKNHTQSYEIKNLNVNVIGTIDSIFIRAVPWHSFEKLVELKLECLPHLSSSEARPVASFFVTWCEIDQKKKDRKEYAKSQTNRLQTVWNYEKLKCHPYMNWN